MSSDQFGFMTVIVEIPAAGIFHGEDEFVQLYP